MAHAVLPERGRERGAVESATLKDSLAKPCELVAAVIGRIGRGKEDGGFPIGKDLLHLVEAEHRVARPACEAERVERAAVKARLDDLDQAFRRFRLPLEGAREEPFRQSPFKRGAIGADPGAPAAKLFGEVRGYEPVRRQRKTNEPGGRGCAAAGDAGPRPLIGRGLVNIMLKRLVQLLLPSTPARLPLRRRRPRRRHCQGLPASPIQRRCARA